MRRLFLVLAIGVMVGFAGCAVDQTDDDPGDAIADGTDDSNDAETDDGTDAPDTADNGGDDDPDRETDVDPLPEDDSDGADTPDGELELHHIDVGQADSTLIITPDGETILIDTGDWRQSGQQVIAYLEEIGVERIDHLVATHPHADHIGGHDAIIEWAEEEGHGIGAAYDSGIPHTSATYDRYLDAIEEYDVDLLIVEEGDKLPLTADSLGALVVNPPADDSDDDLHSNSVSIVFEFGDFTYLTTGDAERRVETQLIDDWAAEVDADVYQAGHHGSSTSSTQPFLDAVTPEIAIISSKLDSQYGHPHDEVLDRFADMDIETYWTGVHGDIVVVTDGDTTRVEPTEAFSPDPAQLRAEKPDND